MIATARRQTEGSLIYIIDKADLYLRVRDGLRQVMVRTWTPKYDHVDLTLEQLFPKWGAGPPGGYRANGEGGGGGGSMGNKFLKIHLFVNLSFLLMLMLITFLSNLLFYFRN